MNSCALLAKSCAPTQACIHPKKGEPSSHLRRGTVCSSSQLTSEATVFQSFRPEWKRPDLGGVRRRQERILEQKEAL